ncbi:MAG: Kazal-type serine protease inhibitor domain-containing protein [Armatimonadota bacterium]|nr:Kazal-type serine protease inhibitor domain-containing protein [Armatimonadota bacterium]
MAGRLGAPLVVMLLAVAGCNGTSTGHGEFPPDPAALDTSAHALINMEVVPSGVLCIDLRVHGQDRTVAFRYSVTPGSRASLRSTGLPTGRVTFIAEAFDVACAAVTPGTNASWRSEPRDEVLLPATTAVVLLTLRRNGVSELSFDFEFAQECDPAMPVCEAGEFCAVLDCADRIGGCLERPASCPSVYEPVCGCNGITYSNLCEAARAGASVRQPGTCPCGGASGLACPPGYYCQQPPGACGAPGAEGVCAAPVVACPVERDPVCGCNGRTYDNVCAMTAAGQSLRHTGACVPSVCGGPDGIPCADFAMSCFYPDGVCPGSGAFGECRLRPAACPLGFGQVCGCNGVTYSTECRANLVGQSVRSRGACP